MSAAGRTGGALEGRLRRWLEGRPDETVLRWLFRGLVVATFVVLGLDLADMQRQEEQAAAARAPGTAPQVEPYLPSVREEGPGDVPATADLAEILRQPARFELMPGGRLMFLGAIEPGAAERFASEIGKRGDYVGTVVISSPGGSVSDAMAIARIIRDNGFDTEVASGSYCASSCPLVLAGGVQRTAAPDALVGVHRVYAAGQTSAGADVGMDNAQRVSAECQRFLVEMGVDPRVWIHAMETPKEELFYFTPDELIGLKLATRIDPPA